MEMLKSIFDGYTINYNLLWWVLAAFILADFATGIAKAYKVDGKIISSRLRDGGFKKCGIVGSCLICYILSLLFSDNNFVICNAALAYYIYTELVSIIENLIILDVPLPPMLIRIVGDSYKKEANI